MRFFLNALLPREGTLSSICHHSLYLPKLKATHCQVFCVQNLMSTRIPCLLDQNMSLFLQWKELEFLFITSSDWEYFYLVKKDYYLNGFYLYIYSLPCSNEQLGNFHNLGETCDPYSISGYHPHPKEPKKASPAFFILGFFFSLYIDFIQQQPKIKCTFLNFSILLWSPKCSPSHKIQTQTWVSSFSARETN